MKLGTFVAKTGISPHFSKIVHRTSATKFYIFLCIIFRAD